MLYFAHSGLGNQAIVLAQALEIAYALGRTLVLPPVMRHNDVGRPKAMVRGVLASAWGARMRCESSNSLLQVAAEFVMRRIGTVTVTPHYCPIQDKDAAWYRQFQVIVLGLDSIEVRCVSLKIGRGAPALQRSRATSRRRRS